jgi:TPR repeat protein
VGINQSKEKILQHLNKSPLPRFGETRPHERVEAPEPKGDDAEQRALNKRRAIQDTVDFFKEKARHGHISALYCLGWCYYYGVGVGKNLENSNIGVDLLRRAADRGSVGAQTTLGLLGTDSVEKKYLVSVYDDPETERELKRLRIISGNFGKELPCRKWDTMAIHHFRPAMVMPLSR